MRETIAVGLTSFVLINSVCQSIDRLNIQIVCRLILRGIRRGRLGIRGLPRLHTPDPAHHNQDVGFHEGELGKHDPRLLPAREVPHLDGVSVAGQTIATQRPSRQLVVHVKLPLRAQIA